MTCAHTRERSREHPLSQPLVGKSSEAYDGRKKSFNKTTVKIRNELHIKRALAVHCQTKPMRDKQVCFIRVKTSSSCITWAGWLAEMKEIPSKTLSSRKKSGFVCWKETFKLFLLNLGFYFAGLMTLKVYKICRLRV